MEFFVFLQSCSVWTHLSWYNQTVTLAYDRGARARSYSADIWHRGNFQKMPQRWQGSLCVCASICEEPTRSIVSNEEKEGLEAVQRKDVYHFLIKNVLVETRKKSRLSSYQPDRSGGRAATLGFILVSLQIISRDVRRQVFLLFALQSESVAQRPVYGFRWWHVICYQTTEVFTGSLYSSGRETLS